ncbi:MAG: uracil-DNA glycosylase family protein [bacterium]
MELYGNDIYIDFDFGPGGSVERPVTLEGFFQQIRNCQQCRLAGKRTQLVFGVGNPRATLMCIGEAPGVDEDRQGEPFVGKAGQLLNKILAAIGFERKEVYIANVIKCRPPNNRDPGPDELAECLPFLHRQIELISPKLIMALGRVAAQSLLGRADSISILRTKAHRFAEIPLVVTYHPAALLRNTQLKRPTWEDAKKLRKMYDEIVGDKPIMDL